MTNPTGPRRGLPAKGLKIIIQCLIVSYACFNTAQAQKTSTLWFNSNGQLISYPPEMVQPGERLAARISLDRNFWAARTSTVLNSWLNVLENLKKPVSPKAVYTFGNGEFKDVMGEMACKMIDLLNKTAYLSADQKAYYQKRLKLLAIPTETTCKTNLAPSIDNLIEPRFEIVYFFYDSTGGRINANGEPHCTGDDIIRAFRVCSDDKKSGTMGSMETGPANVPVHCSEVRYQLRVMNNSAAAITNWMSDPSVIFPTDYEDKIVKVIEKDFGEEFIKQQGFFYKQLDTLSREPLNRNIDLNPIKAFIKSGQDNVKKIQQRLNSTSSGNQYRNWVARWLWFTGGVPQMNPLAAGPAIFPDNKPNAKVSPQDKALYQVFESMVAKGAVKIRDLGQIDSGFKNIPRIKAALDAEAGQQANEQVLQDKFLYSGMLKSSAHKSLLMRHIDALSNYTVMGANPRKEITEDEQLYVLVENKSVPQKLSIAFQTVAIATENSFLTNEIDFSGTDKAGHPALPSPDSLDTTRRRTIDSLRNEMKTLVSMVTAFRALPVAPSVSVYFEKDNTPDLMTDILEHDYLFDAPATATYSIKQTNPDNTEKEVAKGGYRINKLYHFRFKAGVVYSFLKKNDFTETAPGNYTLDDPASGIDGTFGIQYFFKEQDIRSKEKKPRCFVYAGLSMKKITENFYVGLGMEPLCGLAISINAHIGKKEALMGENNFPTGIKTAWGVNVAPSILIDPSLFVRLFSFGNTNKSLIGF